MSIGGSSPPYTTLHDFQYPFLDFPPGLSQVDGPYMNEMIGIFIAIGKIEILIHGRIDQCSVSIQSMSLAAIFLIYHV